VNYEKKRSKDLRKTMSRGSKKGRKGEETTKEWVTRKKELYKLRGKEGVPRDSKCARFLFLSYLTLLPLLSPSFVLLCIPSTPLLDGADPFPPRRYTARSRKARF
jgi:hypothetical protein